MIFLCDHRLVLFTSYTDHHSLMCVSVLTPVPCRVFPYLQQVSYIPYNPAQSQAMGNQAGYWAHQGQGTFPSSSSLSILPFPVSSPFLFRLFIYAYAPHQHNLRFSLSPHHPISSALPLLFPFYQSHPSFCISDGQGQPVYMTAGPGGMAVQGQTVDANGMVRNKNKTLKLYSAPSSPLRYFENARW